MKLRRIRRVSRTRIPARPNSCLQIFPWIRIAVTTPIHCKRQLIATCWPKSSKALFDEEKGGILQPETADTHTQCSVHSSFANSPAHPFHPTVFVDSVRRAGSSTCEILDPQSDLSQTQREKRREGVNIGPQKHAPAASRGTRMRVWLE
jgi:hypothetical protein